MYSAYQAPPIPKSFIWRRAHSLTGLWLVLFLIEHLFVNSQAALWIGDDGNAFVRSVNALRNLPYLEAIEIVFLGIPFLIHGIWGVRYLMTSKNNSFPTDGSAPALTQYSRNHAFTWQRITSWILLFGIAAHVIHMRFMEYPKSEMVDHKRQYMVKLSKDEGLQSLSKRLDFTLFNPQQIKVDKVRFLLQSSAKVEESDPREKERARIDALEKWQLKEGEVIAMTPSFGTAELLMVRNTFKSPVMILLYTGLVLAACFHGFNGLWTWLISWGITLTARSQQRMRTLATALMVLISFLGLAAIWATYWVNLRQ